jgi:hypothetical protein
MGGLLFAGTIGAGRQYWSGESGHIMPRIGMAYQLTPNPENSCTAALLGLS